ncbi:MAG: hypothetical protein ACYDH9_08215 [Limisphaerales bacterium]
MNENNMTTVLGGEDLTVTLLDGTSKIVRVRQLKVSELPKYALVFEDDAKCIELFCAEQPGWADTLTLESAMALLERGHALNSDFLARIARAKNALREKLLPGYREMLSKLLKSQLPSSAVGSPPKPD